MPDSLEQKILGAQVSGLMRNGPILVTVNAANTLALSFLYGARVDSPFFWPWLLAQAAFTAQRFFALRAFFRGPAPGAQKPPRVWANRTFRANLSAGLLWAFWVLTWRDAVPPSLFIIECALLGCVGLIGLSSFLPGFYAFCVPLTLAFAYSSIDHPAAPFHAKGFGGIPFFILLSIFAHLWNRNLLEMYRLRFENLDLVRDLTAAKSKAEQALVSKSRFLAAASHDLRQPLQAQGLFLHALGNGPAKGVLGKLRATHQALTGLLDSLLDLSMAESGTLKPRPRAFALETLFHELKDEFAPLARRKGLALVCPPTKAWALSDPDLLARMLRNLLSNALRHTIKGKVGLICRAGRKGLRIEVRDTGPGIPPKEQEKVFKEFYQLQNPQKDSAKGLGLGLSIVKSLGNTLGHPVTLVSLPKIRKGCLFTIQVPSAKPGGLSPPAPAIAVPFRGQTVLIVDDEKTAREGLKALLESWNLKTVTAASAAEMVGLLRRKKVKGPLALISDYRLGGGKTGTEAVRAIRAILKYPAPSILITGDHSPKPLLEAKTLGIPILYKPIDPARIRETLSGRLTGWEK